MFDNKLQNGFEFNEYFAPEFISKMNDSSNIYTQENFKIHIVMYGNWVFYFIK